MATEERQRGGAKEEIPPVSGVVCSNTPLTVFTEIEKRRRKG
jgi:hypothetical protein